MTVVDLGVPSLGPTDPAPADGPLVDTFGRVATDLRVSLTDRCNLRCTYCMPADGLDWLPGEQLLSAAELTRLLRIAVTRLGITSVRFTGGEPLVAKHLEDVVAATASLRPRPEITLTTNGIGLARRAAKLKRAGLDRINVSLDTVDAARLHPHHPPRPAARCTGRPAGREGRRAGAGEGQRGARSGHGPGRRRRPVAVLPRPRIPAAHHRADAARRRSPVAARQGHRRRRRARGVAPAFRSDARLGAAGFGARGTVAGRRRSRRIGDGRHHRVGLARVLRGVRPHPPHRRRPGAQLPVRAAGDRPAPAHAYRCRRRAASKPRGVPRCGPRRPGTASTSPASSSRTVR